MKLQPQCPPAVVSVRRKSVLGALLLTLAAPGWAEPIRVCPANPHYFTRDGRPLVLVASDHHYGAVIDVDFDYVRYLDYLAASGMNLTRIYPGAIKKSKRLKWRGGDLRLTTPAYSLDVALRMRADPVH